MHAVVWELPMMYLDMIIVHRSWVHRVKTELFVDVVSTLVC